MADRVTVYAVIHCDANSSGGELNSLHLSRDDAHTAVIKLAERMYPIYAESEPDEFEPGIDPRAHTEWEIALDELRAFADVSVDIEEIDVPAAFLTQIAEKLAEEA